MPVVVSKAMKELDDDNNIKDLLEEALLRYNQPGFIPDDPVSVPHRFKGKENIEIAGFFAATLAWGNRKTIIRNTMTLMKWMDDDPHAFITGFTDQDLKPFSGFVHRTFNGDDCLYFLHALRYLYTEKGGLEGAFTGDFPFIDIKTAIGRFRNSFFSLPHLPRTQKHVANPLKNSSAKRINMFLRWMVRTNEGGVDFGLWNRMPLAQLMCPLDVHSGAVARKLGLLDRKQNDWKAVEELTASLRRFDAADPVKYDLALFGLGVDRRL